MQAIRVLRSDTAFPPSLLSLLPARLSDALRRLCLPHPEELRLHASRYATVYAGGDTHSTDVALSEEELSQTLRRMCEGSLYAFAETINRGYLTLDGGIRVGVCGSAATEAGRVIGVSRITGLTVRIPHAVEVDVEPLWKHLNALSFPSGLLIYSPPGVGKTTLLRALALRLSASPRGRRTVVVDSRAELSPTLGGKALDLDVLVGYPRACGIEIAVRSLGAEVVLCDEIGSADDAEAVLSAASCGVPLIATAHAKDVRELLLRPPLRRLHDARVFGAYAGLRRAPRQGLSYLVTSWQDAEHCGRQL